MESVEAWRTSEQNIATAELLTESKMDVLDQGIRTMMMAIRIPGKSRMRRGYSRSGRRDDDCH
jgi:hypothetical protein